MCNFLFLSFSFLSAIRLRKLRKRYLGLVGWIEDPKPSDPHVFEREDRLKYGYICTLIQFPTLSSTYPSVFNVLGVENPCTESRFKVSSETLKHG